MVVGLAVNDIRIYKAMRKSFKAEYEMRHNGYVTKAFIHTASGNYEHMFAVSFERSPYELELSTDTVLVQTAEPAPEEEFEYWLH